MKFKPIKIHWQREYDSLDDIYKMIDISKTMRIDNHALYIFGSYGYRYILEIENEWGGCHDKPINKEMLKQLVWKLYR